MELANHLDELVWKDYPDTRQICIGTKYINIDDIFYNMKNFVLYIINKVILLFTTVDLIF